jgi:hypothetical protein
MEVDMRKLIAGMKISVDGKIEGPERIVSSCQVDVVVFK